MDLHISQKHMTTMPQANLFCDNYCLNMIGSWLSYMVSK